MSYLTEITAKIKKLEESGKTILAGMCAASVLPVVKRFAEDDARVLFERGLKCIWKSIGSDNHDSTLASIRKRIVYLQEVADSDRNMRVYDAMSALSVLVYAIDTKIGNDSNRAARDACCETVNRCGGYDYSVTHGRKAILIDPRNPPPPGRMQALHMSSQFRLIALLKKDDGFQVRTVQEAKAMAEQIASEIDKVLPLYARNNDYD